MGGRSATADVILFVLPRGRARCYAHGTEENAFRRAP